jgi:Tfp pilus assembly protein PilP
MEAFDAAWKHVLDHEDRDTLALMVQALNEPMPSAERWAQIWKRVVLVKDESDPARPTRRVVWPDVPPTPGRVYRGHPISLDLKSGDLSNVFRLFADASGLNVVVSPGVSGKVTAKINEAPWDQALDRILAPNGLSYSWEGSVLRIAPPSQLAGGTAARASSKFSGALVDVDFKDIDLGAALSALAANGNVTVTIEPSVHERVTVKLNRVPWDQAFDLVAKTNGLVSMREGNALRVSPAPRRRATAESDAVTAPSTRRPPLTQLGIDDLALRGIVKNEVSGYVALLTTPDGPPRFAKVGTVLSDGEVTAIDAKTVTFRRNSDRREIVKTLYPQPPMP